MTTPPDVGPIDLYARLGVPGPIDRARLLEVLDDRAADPVARRTAAFVLSDEERRKAHDAWWRTLSAVSVLRAQLGLTATVLWSRSPRGDFARVDATPERLRETTPRGPLTAIHAAD